LLGLGFNSRKCCHTFVNWYKAIAQLTFVMTLTALSWERIDKSIIDLED
jgi:hypothetical protein